MVLNYQLLFKELTRVKIIKTQLNMMVWSTYSNLRKCQEQENSSCKYFKVPSELSTVQEFTTDSSLAKVWRLPVRPSGDWVIHSFVVVIVSIFLFQEHFNKIRDSMKDKAYKQSPLEGMCLAVSKTKWPLQVISEETHCKILKWSTFR